MNRFITLASALMMAAVSMADVDFDKGIIITNCKRDTGGVWVDFATEHEPPYYVGVYPVQDFLDAGYFAEAVTTNKYAYVQGDFTDFPVNVKVLLPSRVVQLNGRDGSKNLHRRLSDSERKEFAAIASSDPIPDTRRTERWVDVIGWPGPILYECQVVVKSGYKVNYNGMTNTTGTIKFKPVPVPSSVEGEEGILYWIRSTLSLTSYNPATQNQWCLWSDTWYPKYLMYKNGPMFSLESDVPTYTDEQLAEMAANDPHGIAFIETIVPGTNAVLQRGTVTSASSIAGPAFSWTGAPNYHFKKVYDYQHFYEYNHEWDIHPLSEPKAGEEILWQGMSNKTNVSNSVYLPKLLKGIPSNSPQRITSDYYGRAIIVTNTPSHWESRGIVDLPPDSNTLMRVIFQAEENSE